MKSELLGLAEETGRQQLLGDRLGLYRILSRVDPCLEILNALLAGWIRGLQNEPYILFELFLLDSVTELAILGRGHFPGTLRA
jgi:hypothetical protein